MESFIGWIGGKRLLRKEILGRGLYDRGMMEYIPNVQPRTGKHLILEQHGNRKKS